MSIKPTLSGFAIRSAMHAFRFIFTLSLLLLAAPLQASAQTSTPAQQASDRPDAICRTVESAARTNALPLDFFTRLIWQESRFQSYEVGPVTRSGQRALGIAQFMPGTAVQHRLLNPFNPVEALPKSAEFLAELRDRFGNLGLAAAAYNAGPQRVRDFIAGSRGLPTETRNYVLAITGRLVEDWIKPAKEQSNAGANSAPHADTAIENCYNIVALHNPPLNSFLRVPAQYARVPSWCHHLHHPNKEICGPIHEAEPMIRISSLVKLKVH